MDWTRSVVNIGPDGKAVAAGRDSAIPFARLPPMHCLAAFEAAARLGTFAEAADELCVTHSAVSHRIRHLEEHLGVVMFVRVYKQVVLTPAGADFLRAVQQTMGPLAQAAKALGERKHRRLVVTAGPGVASYVLIPHLNDFLQSVGDVDIEIDASSRLVDLNRDGVDLGIRLGSGNWPGYQTELLAEDYVYAMSSPSYAMKFGMRRHLPELARARLIHTGSFSWNQWFSAHGQPATMVREEGLVFKETATAVNAAVHGLGVVLSNRGSALGPRREGRLTAFMEDGINLRRHYFGVYAPNSPQADLIRKFLDWLQPVLTYALNGDERPSVAKLRA